MRIVILSGSKESAVTSDTFEKVFEIKGAEVVGIIFRKISFSVRLREELRQGGLNFLKKISKKLIIPKLKRFFGIGERNKAIFPTDKTFLVSNLNSQECLHIVKNLSPDIILYTGGGIIQKPLLSLPKIGILNCHIGILPEYRGMFPFVWAILNEQTDNIGCTVHFMDSGIDTGPILFTKRVELTNTPFNKLLTHLENMISDCFAEAIRLNIEGNFYVACQKDEDGRQYYIPHKVLIAEAKKIYEKKRLSNLL